MFAYFNRLRIKQCLITHRKHVKRRMINGSGSKRLYSSSKYLKLGNLYARLGLLADASHDEIKTAYYKLSKEHHPDRNEGCSDSTEKFRSVTEAYEILGNVASRAQYDRETPYGRVQRRSRYKQQEAQSSSTFTEKDEELAEKIRIFRENMRKRAKKSNSEDEEFTFRRENMFDFEAWYNAHFNDDFETKMRNERIKKYAEQYQEQKERILRGETFRVRPPRPYLERKDPSDIEMQMEEMTQTQIRNEIRNTLMLGMIVMVSICIAIIIIETKKESGPYEDLYAKQRAGEAATKPE